MTYTIIGGDGKEYGPISANDVRQWVAEGRLNAQSLCKAESDAEFRALDKFPEFADVFVNQVPPPLAALNSGNLSREQALKKIKVPALGLEIGAGINLILSVWSLLQMMFSASKIQAQQMAELNTLLHQMNDQQFLDLLQKTMNNPQFLGIVHIVSITFALLATALSALILLGAFKMQSLRSYEFSFVAALLSVIPCLTPCYGYVIGLFFGIWALTLLTKPKIKSQFN